MMLLQRGTFFGMRLFTILQFLIVTQTASVTLPDNYDPNIRPNNGGVADVISVSVGSITIQEVDESLQKISVECILHTFWDDKRLSNLVERTSVYAEKLPNVWTPTLSIVNSAEMPIRSNKALSLKSDGTVDYAERVSAKISCQMSMMRYPFGKQHCKLELVSYGYSSIHLILLWNGIIPLQNIKTFDPKYSISHVEQTSERHKTPAGEFSHIIVEISLNRSPFRLILQALLPTFFFAALSYFITFCMGRSCTSRHNNNNNQEKCAKTSLEEEGPESEVKEDEKLQISQNSFSFASYIGLDFIKLVVNVFILLIVIILQQINAVTIPTLTALDVWVGFMCVTVFVCFVVTLQFCVKKWQYFLREMPISQTDKDTSALVQKIINILRISIPVLFIVFLIAFLGFCLS
ncbi:gamma-aminobutyric acid receptor subunit beta [Folsomia candida]|uniref:gamma-aminobutyric acid receptor subunit beta n=1 Tax=Folsomia candida TaxID=158441 RepID=UPI000B9024CD|nr:gamma-aminobutyric acid receptor subunit beta [Folsomia candida]